MTWETVVQILTAVSGAAAALFAVFKLLIKDNFAKSKVIEELKAKNTNDAMTRLEANQNQQQVRLNEFKTELGTAAHAYTKAAADMNKMIIMLKSYVQKSEKRLSSVESEIVKLGDELIMVRSKGRG